MKNPTLLRTAALPILWAVIPLCAQESAVWRDPSPHRVEFVVAEENVRLEVLDWGGSGRPLVLLAGLGNTAHIFDDLAPKLAVDYHLSAITRRGYGASSVPDSGYGADRLGDDVLAVLDALAINRPVLAGHSIAGEELSSVGMRHPERIAGLIYLDAAYGYAYDPPSGNKVGIWQTLEDLRKNTEEMQTRAAALDDAGTKLVLQLLLEKNLPGAQRELETFQKFLNAAPLKLPSPSPPSPADLASFSALRSWFTRNQGYTPPEAELRATRESHPDGGVGASRTPPRVPQAIIAGSQKYRDLRAPVLAIYAIPHDRGPWFRDFGSVEMRAAYDSSDASVSEAQAKALEAGVPNARVVRLARANHYVFVTHEADVLREMRAFIAALP